MASILLFRTHANRLSAGSLHKISRHLGIGGKAQEAEEAVVAVSERQTLVYAQPCSRMAGVLFYTDQSQSIAEPVKRPLGDAKARAWGDAFLRGFDLLPKTPEDDRIALKIDTHAQRTDGIVFDGKERKPIAMKTDFRTRVTLNGIPVVGPRARARMVFKEGERPALVHVGFWHTMDVYEEREWVREHDIVNTVHERISRREKCGEARYDLIDVKLAYFAGEFRGGPDVLLPYYFVELEQMDPHPKARGRVQGPRQLLRLPAYR